VYISDTGNRRIQKLTPDGKAMAQWGTYGDAAGQFKSPSGIAVDTQGNIYVADLEAGTVQKLSPDGEPLAEWGSAGSAPGQFKNPGGIAVDAWGNIYVADTGNYRIQKLSPDGSQAAEYGYGGTGPEFDLPTIVVDGKAISTPVGNNRFRNSRPTGRHSFGPENTAGTI
jgi:sugar lactone lactonase YvrE